MSPHKAEKAALESTLAVSFKCDGADDCTGRVGKCGECGELVSRCYCGHRTGLCACGSSQAEKVLGVAPWVRK